MKKHSYIEIIYISPNNKIIINNITFSKNLTLKSVLNDLVQKSIFSKEFLSQKIFGCYGEIISSDYMIKENDRIEILDELKMSPNDKRKHNFKRNQ